MWINTNPALQAFCAAVSTSRFITLDTEFIRERTYWPQLCLIQVAGEDGVLAAIDALAEGLDLSPFYALLDNPAIIKVFHAARQDIEIFHHLTGKIPTPLADSQVMAMACGHGEAASYESLASKIAKVSLDKSSRFTDWAARPLSPKQLAYALDDVRYLRPIYESLAAELARSGRTAWINEEMALFADPATYAPDPEQAWKKLKLKIDKPRLFTLVKALAAWREREARHQDVPRSRILRDEALLELAQHAPETVEALGKLRGLPQDFARSSKIPALLEVCRAAKACPAEALPAALQKKPLPPQLGPVLDMLKVLLRFVSEEAGVAAKLIASASDLESLALLEDVAASPLPAMQGWRFTLFGSKVADLKSGKLGLKLEQNKVTFVSL